MFESESESRRLRKFHLIENNVILSTAGLASATILIMAVVLMHIRRTKYISGVPSTFDGTGALTNGPMTWNPENVSSWIPNLI